MNFQDLLKRILGATASKVNAAGNALGNPLPDLGLTEKGEYIGSQPLSTEERIAKSLENTGAIAEGDYQTGVNLGYSPLALPSRADGGILTQPQMAQNSDAVSRYLASQGVTDINTLNPAQRTEYDRLQQENAPAGGGGGGIDFNALVEQQRALARSAYEEGMRRAGAAYDRARGLYDEGTQLLGQRRGEFQKLFDTGNVDIATEYQGRGGELGTSAQNRRMSDAAALQAQGFGGSAVERAQNRSSRDETRALRSLQENRDENKKENLGQFNERQTWANTQESGLRRGLEDAAEARRAAENQAGLVEAGDYQGITNNINGFLQSILQNQLALDASNKGVSEYTANPYAVNIDSVAGQLQQQLPQVSGGRGTTTANQGVSLDEQQKRLALLRKQSGGNMYGLA
jgi:hypothetical protein